MTDTFFTITLDRLFQIFTSEKNLSALGLTKNLNFKNKESLKGKFIGHPLHTPFGVAAGPHSQMAQNIIAAYISGARYIELKTVQVLDELTVSKPCIDMADEGYNCEWSQELRIEESFNEYLNAWIMVHIINHTHNKNNEEPGVIFNMSIGYNYEGILSPKVQWFLDKMRNCREEKEQKIKELSAFYPDILKINIPDCISDNLTISTMHGCPPDEIEKIALYLLEERKLNTILKLNPTLLGKDQLRDILNKTLSFYTVVPDEAFEHDLKYPQAIIILNKLIQSAEKNNVFFGVKLTNTLESLNNKNVFESSQTHMYMSGRALHPISINLAHKLQSEFKGQLNISFSAGADCFNIGEVLACGLYPVTVSSDILKPGGYGRLFQYADEIENRLNSLNAKTIHEFILKTNNNKTKDIRSASLNNLEQYAVKVLTDKAYKKDLFFEKNIKTNKTLGEFDCIGAPCTYTCPTHQDIPEYMFHASKGNFKEAFKTILRTNPFPNVLGMVCDHKCQTKCTRINYDEDLRIRDVKWYISENNNGKFLKEPMPFNGMKVAVIGAGPSGLSCAYFLRLAGLEVTVYESKEIPGGMVSEAIPYFRLKEKSLQMDIERIKSLGVDIHYNAKIDKKSFEKISEAFNYIYIAVGAQKIKKMGIEGENSLGVVDPIEFLSAIKKNTIDFKGKNIAVIGGGNTAMDIARAALRLIKDEGNVTLVYRRTVNEMPADKEEIEALLSEGICVKDLTQPLSVITENGKATGLKCIKMKLTEKDTSGRTQVVALDDSEFDLSFDTIIPAIGQDIHIDFINDDVLKSIIKNKNGYNNIYIGGDAYRGASTIVNAVADGKKTAHNIINSINYYFPDKKEESIPVLSYDELMLKRSQRAFSELPKIALNRYETTVPDIQYSEKDVIEEAARCLFCNQLCNICVTVCPNKANYCYDSDIIDLKVPKLLLENGNFSYGEEIPFTINQKYQIINIGDFCNECGNCNTFCPTSEAPYIKKPKFYLTVQSFNKVSSGFFITKHEDKIVLVNKVENVFETLTYKNNEYIFETDNVVVVFNESDFSVKSVKVLTNVVCEIPLENAAKMKILLKGVEPLY